MSMEYKDGNVGGEYIWMIKGGMSKENKVGKHINDQVRDVCSSDCSGYTMDVGYWRPHQ